MADATSDTTSTHRTIGWLFVAIQAVLLLGLIFGPTGSAWPGPPWLRLLGMALIVAGLVIIAAAALGLGSALTATPVPTKSGQLTTTGLYRFVRHPIYSAVLTITLGLTIRSRSWFALALAVAIVVFFSAKARWEEARLAERYPTYAAYAARTPRFVPRPSLRHQP